MHYICMPLLLENAPSTDHSKRSCREGKRQTLGEAKKTARRKGWQTVDQSESEEEVPGTTHQSNE